PAEAAGDPAPAAETARLRAHFAHLDRELRTRDLSALTPAQRAARERALQALREYAAAGRFPHNHHVAERRVPYFVDDHGTLCAMAYLVARSGRGDLVRKVASTRNNAFLRELAEDPELAAWLEENGLTAYEAGRIQPMYEPIDEPASDLVVVSYLVPSVVNLVTSGTLIYHNTRREAASPRIARWRGAMGMASGGFAIAIGLTALEEESVDELAMVNMAVGAISVLTGANALLRGDRPAETTVHLSREVTLAAAPVVTARGAGMHFNLRF
ncbi:MAG TPA: hypothetical protein VFX98_10355, partial [Longimicrobiaceae bacterium]|nr:hypothetical protein [Longimicrobiaceae bacterium]